LFNEDTKVEFEGHKGPIFALSLNKYKNVEELLDNRGLEDYYLNDHINDDEYRSS